MNYLLLDVGNSCLHMARSLSGQDRLGPMDRIPHDPLPDYADALARQWDQLPSDSPREAILASVARTHTAAILDALAHRAITVKQIRLDIPLPLEMAIENPGTVGVDRVLAAGAAWSVMKGPVVVIQLGTAVTVDAVSASGVFLGGAILPGLHVAAKALHSFTAELPPVDVLQPTEPMGRNTEQAIRSGVFYGLVGAMRELVERFAGQLGSWPTVVLTGGSAPLFLDSVDFADRHVPDLVLRGVALAARQHAARLPTD